MGKETAAGGLPLSLSVKNTFIDVDSLYVEDDVEGEDGTFGPQGSVRTRQVSEPPPGPHRPAASTPGAWRPVPDAARSRGNALPGEELREEDELEEPETETEPTLLLKRNDSESLLIAESGCMGRQETEQHWPSWNSCRALDDTSLQPQHPTQALMELGKDWQFWTSPSVEESAGTTGGRAAASEEGQTLEAEPMLVQAGGGAPWVMQMLHGSTPGPELPEEWLQTYTVMMRNLPNKYSQHMLLEELNKSGFLGTFDFLYLPIDPETNANRGYAFINFTDPLYAWMLKQTFEGRRMSCFNSEKVVSVNPAALQGFEANYAHYSSARVNRGDPAARPLFLRESSTQGSFMKPVGRRRGGRRSAGSLIDMAARQQQAVGMGSQMLLGGNLQNAAAAALAGNARNASAALSAKKQESKSLVPQFCPFCGGKTQPEFRFCKFCGASLNFQGA